MASKPKHPLSFVFILSMGLISLGCISVVSTARPNWNGSIRRMYIPLYWGKSYGFGAEHFMSGFGEDLANKLKPYGITCKIHVVNDMNPKEKEVVKAEIDEFKPDSILQIDQTVQKRVNGGNAGGIYELTIHLVGEDAYLWKANIETSSQIGTDTRTGDKIVEHLLKDGIIRPVNGTK